MDLHIREVVIFNLNDYLISLIPDQDQEKIRTYNRKTARVTNIKKISDVNKYYTIRFPDGFVIKEIEDKHLTPIKARNFKSKKHR